MPKGQETVLEIDLNALKHNVTFIKSKLKSNTKFLAVVKAFAYGSDAIEIAKYLETLNVDYFAVAYTDEGIALRNAGVNTPILVLHPLPINFKDIVEYRLEPNIYSQRVLNNFITTSKELKQNNYPIHLKFNTGLNRLGFAENEITTIANKLQETQAIKVKSIFSHLAASEDKNEEKFTLNQIESFKNISKKIIDLLGYQPILHQCNTSGILNYPQAHFNMVRSGIGLYGFGNDKEINKKLKPIATLKTSISQIHTIKKGDSLGYNRAFIAKETTKTATLPIGHADGINRLFGNGKGFVYINNQKAPIIGNVCMDMIMVDVTNIACQESDEVIVFGPQHSAEDLAESINSISYELLTSVSQRVKRTFYR
ncbi:alanine racemase [Lacinutrix venerupis]|uniref:Alanine racemase n=1 Tax=Lacinutrix venerupis TaxID=1486034 RepID=A0AAC9LIM3_9FLAO|nr:alanine racemase [Lacinutrix venerupis]APX98979.1 alanine racemase [Lacinutrix venerupis]